MYFSPRKLKFLLNCYPPYLGAGVRILHLSDDWRHLTVGMRLRWFNRNAVGSHFGGSLYSMVDPHLMLMLMQILGREYYVWDKSARIDYVQASRYPVTAEIQLSDEQIEEIKYRTQSGEKYLPEFAIEIKDSKRQLIATVHKVLYIRRKPDHR
jgi:acyl-coenzyme A thioesterase PaaI-like protein